MCPFVHSLLLYTVYLLTRSLIHSLVTDHFLDVCTDLVLNFHENEHRTMMCHLECVPILRILLWIYFWQMMRKCFSLSSGSDPEYQSYHIYFFDYLVYSSRFKFCYRYEAESLWCNFRLCFCFLSALPGALWKQHVVSSHCRARDICIVRSFPFLKCYNVFGFPSLFTYYCGGSSVSGCGEQGCSLAVVHRLLVGLASLVRAPGCGAQAQ